LLGRDALRPITSSIARSTRAEDGGLYAQFQFQVKRLADGRK
jgi:hypothetical protein